MSEPDESNRKKRGVTANWTNVREAARVLGFATVSLRRAIERNARRAADGGTVAAFDGIVARKCGRTWRVRLGEAWTAAQTPSR
jgi:hypothetical protein